MSNMGGSPPGAAMDHFLRNSYKVIQSIHDNLPAIRAIASHLTPVEDLVEFQTEVEALHARLGLLVAASELMIAATPAGIAMLHSVDAANQRLLLGLQTAALRDETYFSTKTAFDALFLSVQNLTATVNAALLVLAETVSHDELNAALAPILLRLGGAETGYDGAVQDLSDRIDAIMLLLGTTTLAELLALINQLRAEIDDPAKGLNALATASSLLGARVSATELGILSAASSIISLTTSVNTIEGAAYGAAISALQSTTSIHGNDISTNQSNITTLGGLVSDLTTGLSNAASATESLESRIDVTEFDRAIYNAHTLALLARMDITEAGQVADASAIESISTTIEEEGERLTIEAEKVTALTATLGGTYNTLPNSSFESGLRNWAVVSMGDGWEDPIFERDIEPGGSTTLPRDIRCLSASVSGTPTGSLLISSDEFGVEDKKKYILSGYIAAENCRATLEYIIYPVTDGAVGAPGSIGYVVNTPPHYTVTDWTRIHDVIQIPEYGASIKVRLRVSHVTGGSPKVWLMRPMLEPKLPLQINPSNWMDSVVGLDYANATAIQELKVLINAVSGTVNAVLAQATTILSATIGNMKEWKLVQYTTTPPATDPPVVSGFAIQPGIFNAITRASGGTFLRGLNLVFFNEDNTVRLLTNYPTADNNPTTAATAHTNLAAKINGLDVDEPFVLVSVGKFGDPAHAGLMAAIAAAGGNLTGVSADSMYILIGRGLNAAGEPPTDSMQYVLPNTAPYWNARNIKVFDGIPFGLELPSDSAVAVVAQSVVTDDLVALVYHADDGLVAQASRVTALESTVEDNITGVAASAAAISTLETQVQAPETGLLARAASFLSLNTTIAPNSTTVSEYLESIDGIKGRWGISIDVDGRISGVQLLSGVGTPSEFNIVADKFSVVSPTAPDGTPGTLLFSVSDAGVLGLANPVHVGGSIGGSDNVLIMDSGTYMKVIGAGFGASGNLIEWFGATRAVNTCSTSNSISHVTTAGAAYFGGSLAAGQLRSSFQTSTPGDSAAIYTGPIGTNGGARSIISSFNYNQYKEVAGNVVGSWAGSPLAVTMTLKRGGTTLETLSITGSLSAYHDSGTTYITANFSGTVTTYDGGGSPPTVEYSLVLSSGSGLWLSSPSNSGSGQTLSLIISE